MSQRFYVESPVRAEDAFRLTGPEAHHLGRVMRAQPGDRVTLFDGGGCEFTAEVREVARHEVRLWVLERVEADRELPAPLILAVALPKGDRQRWLVEKSVELGVTELAPLITQRGVAQPTDSARKRLERAVVEASKQSGRNRLMTIAAPTAVEAFLGAEADANGRRWLAHPGGTAPAIAAKAALPTRIAVGPEGGFTDDEVANAKECGWSIVGLGPRILRVETAALALATLAAQ